jgi:hypothetical protein
MRITSLLLAPFFIAAVPAMLLSQVDEARDPDLREPILEGNRPESPRGLSVAARCSDTNRGSSVVEFRWSPPPSAVQAQRLDISMFRDGFRTGRFETVGRVPAAQDRLVWGAARAGVNYYWRVMVLTAQGWVPSETGRYEAPICPVDFVDPPRPPG